MSKRKLIRGTTASYRTKNGNQCDLEELAKIYSSMGNIPENIGFGRAAEISLLCRYFLSLVKEHKDKFHEKGKE